MHLIKDKYEHLATNDARELVIDGYPVRGSNIHHLFRALFLKNQGLNLTGYHTLLSKLVALKVPADTFSDNDTKTHMNNAYKNSETQSRNRLTNWVFSGKGIKRQRDR